MKQFDVVFNFRHGDVHVDIEAEDGDQAIAKARSRDYPPVPDFIEATATYSGRGGKREGSGGKAGAKRVAEPRTVKKQICWTEKEWSKIEEGAKNAGVDVASFQRKLIIRFLEDKK